MVLQSQRIETATVMAYGSRIEKGRSGYFRIGLNIVRAHKLMTETSFSKLKLAQQQLKTAIGLFISRNDRISAITLAGAADGILHGLVLKAGKQPFADYVIAVSEAMGGQTPSKAKTGKHINDKLNINDLKHMDEDAKENVVLDVDISALGAILKAIANHHTLVPDHPDFIKAMLRWTWLFYDGEQIKEDEVYEKPAGEEIMKWYSGRTDKIRKAEAILVKKRQDSFNRRPK